MTAATRNIPSLEKIHYNNINDLYLGLLALTISDGYSECVRGLETRASFFLPSIHIVKTPLITIRRTAWRLALREMQWMLSGEAQCPDELATWWRGQLNPDGKYLRGYSEQLRHHGHGGYDQVAALIDGIRHHPSSRRHIITTWDPRDMSMICEINQNPATPTTCHTTIMQFFVVDDTLNAHTYQRSADMLLGVPHNFIQTWALLTWLACRTSLRVGRLIWTFGNAHIYQEESHISTAVALLRADTGSHQAIPNLVYHGKQDSEFQASDFSLDAPAPAPSVEISPRLLISGNEQRIVE